ncbi:WD40 repeat domain-containing serine/threonine protein kinase [Paludisphaera soli]|uniref:WD40 repeat domain-containing serine/threonine protein kinase n=1 Tax=Paludisphaera soli TaxID=2712865 RepID=UPI0013EC8B47|nr:protein kinase [Paludisphaera soli]
MAGSAVDPDDRDEPTTEPDRAIPKPGDDPDATLGDDLDRDLAGVFDGFGSTLVDPVEAPPGPVPPAGESPPSTILDFAADSHAVAESLGFATFFPPVSPDSAESPVGDRTFRYKGCVSPGAFVDGYEIIDLIGWGGMGEVYRARHRLTALGQLVALKLIRRSIWDAEARDSDSSRLVDRFYVEMRAAAMIRDEHVVPVLNAGLHEGFPYYVMMLIEGVSLSARLKSGRMAPVEAASLLEPIVRAAGHAHAKGVVHRDIKPSNIIIDSEGKPYLTDFGLAKMFEQSMSRTLTSKDVLMGTPQYISPEQVRDASRVGPRSDVYSLGATLYEMLTGRPPFTGDDSMSVVLRVLNDPLTPPQRLNPDVPDALDRICVRCLDKDPARRFKSAEELADELARFVKGVPIETQRPTFLETAVDWVRARPSIAALMLAVVASVILGLVSTTIQLRRAREALARLEYQAYLNRLALASGALDAGRVFDARDRLQECPIAFRDWEWRYLDRLRHRKPPVLGGYPGTIYGLAFRPGGGLLAAGGRRGAPWIWDVAKGRKVGELAGLPPTATVYDLAWCRTAEGAERIAATCSDGCVRLWTRSSDEWGTPRELRGHQGGVDALAVSRDGRRLATGGDDGRLLVWDSTGGPDQPILTLALGGPAILGLAFDPSGDRLVSVGEDQPPRTWDLDSGRSTASPRSGRPEEASLAVAVSPSGRFTAVGGADGAVTVWDADAPNRPRELKGHFDAVNSVVFSPDEKRLASADSDGTVTFWDVASLEKVLSRRGHKDAVEALAFSDDGLTLASGGGDRSVMLWDARPWVETASARPRGLDARLGSVAGLAVRGDGLEIATAGADGAVRLWDEPSGTLKRTLRGHVKKVAALAYSPDSRRLASVCRDGEVRVWDLSDPDAEPAGRLMGSHEGRCITLAFSPDGRTLATGGVDRRIHFWSVDGSNRHESTAIDDEVYCLAFSPDGVSLASAGPDEEDGITLWTRRPQGWSPSRRLLGHERQINGVAFSRDGRRLASVSHDWTGRVWDLREGTCTVLRGHVSRIWGVALSEDGRSVATAGGDRSVRVWDGGTGDEEETLLAHGGRVRAVAFDAGGRFLASAGDDGVVYLWDRSRPEAR